LRRIAPFLVMLAGILWGSMGIFVRNLNAAGLATMDIVFLRSLAASLILFVFALFFRRDLLRLKLKDLWCFAGTGIVSLTFFNFCYFRTISSTSMSIAAVLLYTSPAFVMVLSMLIFRERPGRTAPLVLGLTFAGCVLVTGALSDHAALTGTGLLTGLGAGLGYALYSIFSRFALNRGYGSLAITFWTFVFGTLGSAFGTRPAAVLGTVLHDPGLIALTVALALLNSITAYVVYTLGLSYMDNSRAAVLATVEPVAATVFGFLFFHESLTVSGLLGTLLVLAGIVLSGLDHRDSPHGPTDSPESVE